METCIVHTLFDIYKKILIIVVCALLLYRSITRILFVEKWGCTNYI